MKNAINYILSVALVLAPTASIATPEMDQVANENIELTKERALKDAQSMVQVDFDRIVRKAMGEVIVENDVFDLYTGLLTSNDELLNSLGNFTKTYNSIVSIDRAVVERAIQGYRQLVIKRHNLALRGVQIQNSTDKPLLMLNKIFDDFQSLCRVGRSDVNLSLDGTYDIPDVGSDINYSFMFNYGINAPSGVTGSVVGGKDKDQDEKMAKVNGISQSFTSVTGSIAYSGATSASVAYAQAIFPYALAVTAVLMAVSYFKAKRAAVRAANEALAANGKIFTERATHADVAEYYRQECQSLSGLLNDSRKVVQQIFSQPESLQSLYSIAEKSADERQEWLNQSNEVLKVQSTVQGIYAYKNICAEKKAEATKFGNLIGKLKQLNQPVEDLGPNDSVVIVGAEDLNYCGAVDNDSILYIGGDKKIKFSELDEELKIAKKIIDDFSKDYPEKKTISLMNDFIVEAIYSERNSLEADREKVGIAFTQIREQQKVAFEALLLLLDGYRQLRSENSEIDQLLAKERDAIKKFYQFSRRKSQLMVNTMRAVFGRYNYEKLGLEAQLLVNDYRIFEEEYIDVEQVSDLFSEIKRLHEFIMSLKR